MSDHLASFLLAKAPEMRDFANQMPELASELRRMAEDCEIVAEQLRQDRRRGART